MDADQARTMFGSVRVARLATASPSGEPHLVPVTFVVQGNEIAIAIDHKPKKTTNLRRLRNIRENPQVSILADHYDEDWSRLWWARADGTAVIHDGGPERDRAIASLAVKYPQYHRRLPDGPVIVITVSRWSGWSYAE
jgi:PPOX class probable F420-dependent enzyme